MWVITLLPCKRLCIYVPGKEKNDSTLNSKVLKSGHKLVEPCGFVMIRENRKHQ